MAADNKVTVVLGDGLENSFARVRHTRARLYDRKTKRLLAEHNLAGTLAGGDTITIPAFTITTA